MKRLFVVCIVVTTLLLSGCATQGAYTRNQNDVITRQPGLIETVLIVPVAIVAGVTKALVGESRVETPEQYEKRLQAESEARAQAQIFTTTTYVVYSPNINPPPFFPLGLYVRGYYLNGSDEIVFITGGGWHHRYSAHGRYPIGRPFRR
jgi:hypothetical protein